MYLKCQLIYYLEGDRGAVVYRVSLVGGTDKWMRAVIVQFDPVVPYAVENLSPCDGTAVST